MCLFFGVALFIVGCFAHRDAALIASSIFGIGYAIELLAIKISKK